MKFIALLLALAACSPLHYAKTGKCATTATLVTDFVIAGAGLALSVERYNAGAGLSSATAFAGAMGVAFAANLSETVCK